MADLNIEAVAKAAGVHRSTVSRAFSRPGEKTGERQDFFSDSKGLSGSRKIVGC